MPLVSLTSSNKVQNKTEYPKLSLDHGERALILAIESEPTVEYKHTIRAPEIGPDGRVIKEERKTQKGETYEAIVQEYIGQHICFGDYNTLQVKGSDPENCPTCLAAQEEEGITAPAPHYAMHVIKYSLQPGGWQLRDPFNVDLVAWVFSPTRLNQIIDIAEEFEDLRKHDLKLGPCENKKFQKYDINVSNKAAWLEGSDEVVAARKQIVSQTYANNQCPDLSALIAKKISKAEALLDVQKVVDRYAQVNNRGATSTSVPDLSNLKATNADTASGLDAFKPATPDSVETVTEESTETAKPSTQRMDLQDILNDL